MNPGFQCMSCTVLTVKSFFMKQQISWSSFYFSERREVMREIMILSPTVTL